VDETRGFGSLAVLQQGWERHSSRPAARSAGPRSDTGRGTRRTAPTTACRRTSSPPPRCYSARSSSASSSSWRSSRRLGKGCSPARCRRFCRRWPHLDNHLRLLLPLPLRRPHRRPRLLSPTNPLYNKNELVLVLAPAKDFSWGSISSHSPQGTDQKGRSHVRSNKGLGHGEYNTRRISPHIGLGSTLR
jgi:hypothetical protein